MESRKCIIYGFLTALIVLNVSCIRPDPSVLQLKDNWKIQSSAFVPQDGSIISASDFQADKWYSSSVPTTVLAALVENKVYPDPFYGDNLKTIPGYRSGSWLSMPKERVLFAPRGGIVRSLRFPPNGMNYTKPCIWMGLTSRLMSG